ncbi:MAG TPA: ABC transporter ATP-binding protein [Firmicutes bacterium]|nr:ABC transporter ATP-binding protein [Bacillota bacterium]
MRQQQPGQKSAASGQSHRRPRIGVGGGHHGFGRPVEKAKDFRGTLRRLVRYVRPHYKQMMVVFVMAILSTAANLASPKIMGKAITKLFAGAMEKLQGVPGATIDFAYVGRILIILAGLYLFSALFSYLQQIMMASVAQKTVYNLRRDVNAKLGRLPLKFFDSHTHGEILSRVTNDVDNISSTLQQSIIQMLTSVVTLIGVVVMMLTISWQLTLFTLITIPLYVLVTGLVASRSQKYFAAQQRSLGELNGHVEEMYAGHRVIKAFGREQASVAKFKEINEQLFGAAWRAQFISGVIMPLMNMVNNLGYVLISVVGGIFVTKQTLELGDVQAFIQYARQFTQPIMQTANIANVLQSTVASAERVFELLDEGEEVPDKEPPVIIEQPQGKVVFQGVKFGYSPDKPLITDMNIDVQAGQSIAIVGPTGAGKTTLVNLLMRFYEIDGGKITIDGQDIRDLRRGDLRSLFGMVLQDTWLFNGTIRDNIAYGRPGATEEEIVQAAKAAHADHFIRTLPEGYDTVLNEEASNISQGQKQLLTIARAVLADPAILILDEATSSVDTRTEVLIQAAMAQLMQGRTSFVIAHRLSTIRNADLILVMNEGSVIEQGTHEQLLAQGGFYADLYNSQFTSNGVA